MLSNCRERLRRNRVRRRRGWGCGFLCSPEHPDALARAGVGRAGDRVIAWQLRDDALEVDANYSMRWAEAVRERDAVFGRPVVIMPRRELGGGE